MSVVCNSVELEISTASIKRRGRHIEWIQMSNYSTEQTANEVPEVEVFKKYGQQQELKHTAL